jgi:hypothetical protein
LTGKKASFGRTGAAEMPGRVGLLVFDSTNLALKAERLLKSMGVPCSVIPTPVEVTSDCGMALLINERWLEAVTEGMAESVAHGYRLLFPYEHAS